MRYNRSDIRMIALVLLLASSALVIPPQATAEKLPVVRVGTLVIPGYLFVWYLDKFGYDLAAGIDVQYEYFATGPPMMDALAAGKLDIVCLGSVPPLTAAAARAFESYVIAMHQDTTGIMAVMAGPGVKYVPELKGKLIAFPLGTGMHFFLELALKKYGMSIDDVRITNMSPAEASYAFLAGKVDAIVPFGAWIFPLIKEGHWPIFWGWSLYEVGAPGQPDATIIDVRLADTIVTSKAFADKNPDLVVKFLSAFYRAVGDWEKSKEAVFAAQLGEQCRVLGIEMTREMMLTWIYLPTYEKGKYDEKGVGWRFFTLKEQLEFFEKAKIHEWFKAMADFYYRAGTITRTPDPKEFVNGEFIKKLSSLKAATLVSIEAAEKALTEASEAGGDVREAYELLKAGRSAYADGDYYRADELAGKAKLKAIEARDVAITRRNTMIAAVAVLAILVIAGAYYITRIRRKK